MSGKVVFQVVAVYPSGNRYPVRDPHERFVSAEWHRELCERSADPRDEWLYAVDAVESEGGEMVVLERPNGWRVEKRRSGDGWVIAWRSPTMPASAFWYYRTKADVDQAWEYFNEVSRERWRADAAEQREQSCTVCGTAFHTTLPATTCLACTPLLDPVDA